jgi:prepilin-type N-terminal cleavage/methylation domain-containing protein
MKKKLRKKNLVGGFTLIELLIAIAIIAILSAIILSALSSARAKGRDAKRVRNIEEIRTAIELYIAGNGHAPDLGDPSNCGNPEAYDPSCFANEWDGGGTGKPWSTLTTALNPYMKTVPKDPCGVGCYDPSGNYNDRGYFEYVYHAPGTLSYLNDQIGPGTVTVNTYRIFATNLEKGNPKFFGYGPGSF